jgi:hypothetical protein
MAAWLADVEAEQSRLRPQFQSRQQPEEEAPPQFWVPISAIPGHSRTIMPGIPVTGPTPQQRQIASSGYPQPGNGARPRQQQQQQPERPQPRPRPAPGSETPRVIVNGRRVGYGLGFAAAAVVVAGVFGGLAPSGAGGKGLTADMLAKGGDAVAGTALNIGCISIGTAEVGGTANIILPVPVGSDSRPLMLSATAYPTVTVKPTTVNLLACQSSTRPDMSKPADSSANKDVPSSLGTIKNSAFTVNRDALYFKASFTDCKDCTVVTTTDKPIEQDLITNQVAAADAKRISNLIYKGGADNKTYIKAATTKEAESLLEGVEAKYDAQLQTAADAAIKLVLTKQKATPISGVSFVSTTGYGKMSDNYKAAYTTDFNNPAISLQSTKNTATFTPVSQTN